MIGNLLVLEFTAFALFFKYTNQQNISTFYSTTSGKEFAIDYFLKGDGDESKLYIFDINRNKWKKIEGEVVK